MNLRKLLSLLAYQLEDNRVFVPQEFDSQGLMIGEAYSPVDGHSLGRTSVVINRAVMDNVGIFPQCRGASYIIPQGSNLENAMRELDLKVLAS
ncbi:MAG: hypothetical protein AABX66_03305 [Nanoarchaeota archaeon]